jgi:multiple sugar transport system permease protein
MLLRRLQGKHLAPYLFILPNAVLLSVFVIYPVFRAGLLSFQKWNLLSGQTRWVGLANYRAVLADEVFWTSMVNTAYFTLGKVPLGMVGALAIALLLNTKVPLRGLMRSIYFFPVVVSMVVVSLVFRFIFQPEYGLVSAILTRVGFLELPNWLGSTTWAMPIIIVVSTWKGLGHSMVIFLAGLQAIPPHLYEAARIDGANDRQILWSITLPLLKPTTLFVLIISVIASFKVFDQVYVMTGGGPGYATMTIVQYIYRAAFRMFEMGQASAAAWVLFVMVFGLTLFQYRYFNVGGEG